MTCMVIAVVDDSEDNQLLLQVVLGRDHTIHSYYRAIDALEAFASDRPDVVLMDISMPEMDGLTALKHVRSRPAIHNLPVVALTAMALPDDEARFLAAGFDAYVTKPIVDFAQLTSTLEDVIRRRGAG